MLTNFLFSVAFGLLFVEKTTDIFVFTLPDDGIKLGSLVFVNVLYRHGDRTPVSSYPKDPYNNLSYWPDGWGQLTNIGKEQQYDLGQWLRRRYSGFLSEAYSNQEIHVSSSDVDRTLMSAACNLAALYQPEGTQVWNKSIPWQPIPVHTVPENLDQFIAGKRPCARYDAELEKVKNSAEMKRFNEEHADLYNYLSKYSGTKVFDPETLEFLYDTLFIEELYNLTLPNWTKKVYPEQMKPVVSFSFTVLAKTKLLQRLKIGPLLGQMVNNMKKKQKGTLDPDYKMVMYSAHDTTIANLLSALGVFDPQSPPYRSLVLMELWEDSSEKYQVTVSYRNSTAHEPYRLTIPGCAAVCPLDQFAKLLKPVIPTDWEKECKKGILSGDFAFNSLAILALMVSGILAVLLVLSMAFGIVYWKRQKSSSNYFYHPLLQEIN